jgi:hypothetical protein
MELVQIPAMMFSVFESMGALAKVLTNPDESRWPTFRASLKSTFLVAVPQLQAAGLDLAVRQIEKIQKALDRPEAFLKSVLPMLAELSERINDYLHSRALLLVPTAQRSYYETPTHGWEPVIEKLPKAVDNIGEASKCYALGRNTGCVYHLMGVLQEALEALGRRLRVHIDPCKDTWNTLLRNVEDAIAARSGVKAKTWRKLELFYSELVFDLRAVKNAWRNPTMHFRSAYTDQQAKRVYDRVQEFMVHASAQLHGPK